MVCVCSTDHDGSISLVEFHAAWEKWQGRSIDYVQCSSAESDSDSDLEDMRKLSTPSEGFVAPELYGEYDGGYAPWMYAMRKYVRRDDAVSLLGLLRQCNISLKCRPYFNEYSNNEPMGLTLDRLDSWSHAVSVGDFINGVPGIDDQVLDCLADRGPTKCQEAITNHIVL